jgi:fumarate hydratase class I
MSEYQHHEMFALGEDTTPYRKLTSDGVSTVDFDGQEVLKIDPSALAMLAEVAMRDTSHLLRPGHLQQLKYSR